MPGWSSRTSPTPICPAAVRSTGHPPEIRTTGAQPLPQAVVAAARDLLDAVEGTVGVICPPSRLDTTGAALRSSGLTDDRLVVLTALQAKGLEYDGVVVVSPDDIVAESSGGVRTLYVALTRPTQRLITIEEEIGPNEIGSGELRPGSSTAGSWRRSLGSPASDSW